MNLPVGNPIRLTTTYDAAHRLQSVSDSRCNKTLSYAYSPGGRLDTTQDNEGHRTDYLYDPVGRLIGIWAPNDDYIAYAFDAGGRPIEKWYPNGVNSQLAWNPDDSLAQLKNRVAYDDAHVISRHEYTYTALGQRLSSLEKIGSLSQPAQDEATSYDAWDNRTSQSKNGQTTYAISNAANQITEQRTGSPTGTLSAAYVYDDNGNLTKKCEGGTVTKTASDCSGASVTSLTWNPLDQLVQVQKTGLPTESYAYDHAGRRSGKTVNGQTTHYLYNGEDLHAEYTTWTAAQAVYTHGPETDDPLIRSTPTQTIYYHRDGLGSVVATSDASGNIAGARTYDAWGNTLAQTGNIPQYGYTGREPDATGLVYYRARYYDPSIGRFISRDPAGMPDGVNRYAYVGNDPVNATDPSGEIALIDNFIGGVFNAGVGFGVAKLTGQDYSLKQGAIDFGVGFASSGVAGVGKMYTALTYTNTMAGKILTAGGGEFGKAAVSGQSINDPKTFYNAATAAALNATGVVGKIATAAGKKIPGVSTGLYEPDRGVAALLQAPALAPGINKTVGEFISMPGNLVAGGANENIGNLFGGTASPNGNNSGSNSGSQNMASFSQLSAQQSQGGNSWGTGLLGDYTSVGTSSCVKCKF